MTTPAEMDIQTARPSIWRNLSPVWLVPILAIAVSLGIAWRSYAERGVLIEITFQNGAGVTPGETAVRMRDVPIGAVERITFTPDLQNVVIAARIDRTVAEVMPENAEFWVVRPEVSARGISGLSTVLSGVYVEAAFTPLPEPGRVAARAFEGRDGAPLVTPGRAGTRITLRALDGNRLTPGGPVLHRGVEVGHIEAPRLAEGAEGVIFDAFIEAPHDRRVTTATRFWDTSGFNVSLGPRGVQVSVGNLASILTGGIAFDTVLSGGRPVGPTTVFDLYSDETAARESVGSGLGNNALRLAVEFEGSVQGLSPGAQVRFNGVRVGEVSAIAARVVDDGAGLRVRMQSVISLNPQGFGLDEEARPEDLDALLVRLVGEGLRARLATSGIFTTALVIELVQIDDAAPAVLTRPARSLPVLPSVPAQISDLTTSAQGLLERVGNLPMEELLNQAISLMASAETLIGSDDLRATPGAITALLNDARSLIGGEALQALPGDVAATVSDIRAVVAQFNEAQAMSRLVSTLESADAIAANFATASNDVPELVSELRALVERLSRIEAEELVASATRLIASADAFVNAEGTQGLPPALTGALGEVEGALAELRAGGVVANLNTTLSSAASAADAIALAARDLPQLATRLDSLVTQAEALVGAYGARSPINEEALATLREARAAARSFAQLARALERNPNSLLFGR